MMQRDIKELRTTVNQRKLRTMLRATLFCCLLVHALAGVVLQRNDRIVGGGFADEGEYPTQVGIKYLKIYHSCGASILNEKFALTAAHCVDGFNATDLTIRSGSINITGGEVHEVVRIIQHEGYDPSNSYDADIAIIEVSPEFTYGPNVQPAMLPKQGDEPAAGAPATVIGWGLTSINGSQSEILKELTIAVVDQTECVDIYNAVDIAVLPGQLCADIPGGGAGICNTDSGGPLFVDGVIEGLTSWGYGGCANTLGYPSVYNRVAYYRNWILENTGI